MMELTEYTYINEKGKFTQQVPKLYVISITNICGMTRFKEDWIDSMFAPVAGQT
jgi:hypothetical protein